MVIIRDIKACLYCLLIIAWWDHVTVAPEDKRIVVLRRGMLNGLNGIIFVGGQICPNSILGAKLEWKKAQKNERKKKISDTINKIIPHFNPMSTLIVWRPW